MALPELKADAQLVIDRLTKLPASEIDVKAELTDNILPLMIGICEAIQEGVQADMADLADAVDGLIDGSEVLQPETAGQIMGVLEVGKLMANELEKFVKSGKLDDVRKRKLAGMMHAYRQGAQVVGEIIAEITLVDEGDDDEDPDEGEIDPKAFPTGNPIVRDDDDEDEDDEDDLAGGEAG